MNSWILAWGFALLSGTMDCDLITDNNNILNSSNEVEVTNYTGVPLPVRPDQPIAIVIKITGLNVTMTTMCNGTLHDITSPCIIKPSRLPDMSIIEIHLLREFQNLSYGVHSLFVYTGINLDQKDQNTRILLHYENVTDVQETATIIPITTTQLNASTVNVGSHQRDEWALPHSFCDGQSVQLNFSSGAFTLYSSNGVKTVISKYSKTSITLSQIPRRNSIFPAVEVYTPNDTQRNVSVEFFVFSNVEDDIQLSVKYDDDTPGESFKVISKSRIISYTYLKKGNITVHFNAFYKDLQILNISRSVMVLDHYCFQPSPMFSVNHSVRSNPLTVFMSTDLVIKSRKQIYPHPKGCGNDSLGRVSYFWDVTNVKTGRRVTSTLVQLTLSSRTPGLFKVSLKMKVGQFTTSGILYVKIILEPEAKFHNNLLFRSLPLRNNSRITSLADILPVYDQNITTCWNSKLLSADLWGQPEMKNFSVTNLTNASFIQDSYEVRSELGVFEIALGVFNDLHNVEFLFQFLHLYLDVNNTRCTTQIHCLDNCKQRASLSRKFIAKVSANCSSQVEFYGIVENLYFFQHHEKALPTSSRSVHFEKDTITVDTSDLLPGTSYILYVMRNIKMSQYFEQSIPWLFSLHTNTPPNNGQCEIKPKKGLVLQTEFSVECWGWIAGENYTTWDLETTVPLVYSIWYRTADVGQVLIYQGYESSSPPFVLPAGPSSNNHTVQITIEVRDRFGDSSEQTLSVSVKEKHEENNIEENLESLLKNLNHLRAKFQYTQQPESQIHIIKITANEISKILTNDSYESMDLKELLSADFSEIITAMNNSESHILQRLRQTINILTNYTLNWFTNSFLKYLASGKGVYSEKEACHLTTLSLFTIEACTRHPDRMTPESLENVVKTLNVSLTNQLLEAVFNDASKYRQAIDSFTKIINNVYTGIYSHYFAETDELMMKDYMERRVTANDSETMEKVRLVQEFVSSEKNQTALNMQVLSASSVVLMTSIEMIEKVLKAMMTETTLSVNHSFMSMTMTRINSLPLKKYPTSVGEIQLELESQAVGKPSHENVQPNVDLSIVAFRRSPFPEVNDTLYSSSDVLMISANVSCNVTTQTKNKNLPDLHKSYLSFDSTDAAYLDFGVNLHDLTIVYLDLENVSDADSFEIYVKGGILPTKTNFDASFKVRKNQKNYRIPAEKLSHARGFLMIVAKDKTQRRHKRDANMSRCGKTAKRRVGVQVFSAGCRTRSFNTWIPGECKVSFKSSKQSTICHCPHKAGDRSFFISTFYVQPNLIDFTSIGHFITDFDVDNAAVYGALILLLCLYVVLVIVLRRQDHRDTLKWVPQFLCDNGENDVYYYMITIYTGMRRGSATMSNVNFIIVGEEEDSGIRLLSGSDHNGFDAGSVRRFILGSSLKYGRLNYLRIWHDNSGQGDLKSWFLNKIIVDDLQTKERFIFHCGRWLSFNHDDGKTERVLPVSTTKHLNSFSNRFSEHAQFNLTDSHLLVSTIIRPESSNFSRVQRVSCFFVLLLLSMISHAMYFKDSTNVTPSQVKIGSLSFSLKDIYVSMIVVLITTPPVMLASVVFKKSAQKVNYLGKVFPRRLSTSSQKYASTKSFEPHKMNLVSMFETEKPIFPGWTLYLAWVILVLTALASAFFLLLYSLQWGKARSTRWIISFLMSVLESVLVVDPVKVLFMAMMTALFLKNKETQYKLRVDLRHLRRLAREFYNKNYGSLNVLRKQILGRQEPTLDQDVKKFRNRRQQEMNARRVFRELLIYCLFAFIVFSISYIHKDQRSFSLKNNINNMLIQDSMSKNKFSKLNQTSDYYNWLKAAVIPQLFPSRDWSNRTLPSSPWFGDLVNVRVGGVKLRQVRVSDEPCTTSFLHIVRPCVHEYQDNKIEIRDFDPKWNPQRNMSYTPKMLNNAWTYTSDDEGLQIPGHVHVYEPGGYMVLFPDNQMETLDLVNHLLEYRWLDRRTRAIFLEINLYNPNINVFSYVMFIAEFLETGGIVPWSDVWVFRPNEFAGAMGTYAGLCYILFLIFLVGGTISLTRRLIKRRLAFLKDIWNTVDLACILLSYIGVVIFSIRLSKANETMAKFNYNQSKFISFQSVFLWDFAFNCIIGILTFITTLRTLKILGYNRRLTEIFRVITTAARDLIGFGFVFIIIYTAYVLFGFLIFGKTLNDYSTVFRSFGTLTNSLIGKNRLDMMIHVAPEAASFFYFTYSVCVIFTLLTTFSAILNYSIKRVRQQSKNNPEAFGIVDILGSSISDIFGIATTLKQNRNAEKTNLTARRHNIQEEINVIGVIRLLRDIIVKCMGDAFVNAKQDSSFKKMRNPFSPTIRTSLRKQTARNSVNRLERIGTGNFDVNMPERIGTANYDVNKLKRIGTLKDIELSIDPRQDNFVKRRIHYL